MRRFTEDRQKLKELILYISQQEKSDPEYGSTLLNKLLFFSDFLAYAKFGKPITGVEYMRELHGPVPRPVRVPSVVLTEMMKAGELRLDKIPQAFKGHERIKPVARRSPDMSAFSTQEIELVDYVLGQFRGWPAGKISRFTHQYVGWQSVALEETIPYETFFVARKQKLNDREIKKGQEIARRRGWLGKDRRFPSIKSGRS